ncbi:PREDICTED: UDP-glucose iridoid glucosyltransferase-like [Ipomoea nil]|uniref:UDP-glucose iridoid glucosyltransferase-like n=1 Tax=Ipomoea nil TaxID=35883 RepID=UPI000900F645|nr:PREDICTED: UDP-glucose iridoid glucosyltransferase-like [Ipomoea nil]
MENLQGGGGKRRRVVLVPYPFQGHITPMLQLGSILHSRGFSVTVAHPQYNSPPPSSHPELEFHSLYDGLSGYQLSFQSLLAAIYGMNENCRASLEEYLVQLMEEEEKQDIACIIYDNIMFFVDDVATHLKIPTIVLRPFSANYLNSLLSILQQSDAIFPFQDSSILEPLPDLHPLRFKDLPFPTINNHVIEPVVDFSVRTNDIRSSVACIWNSVDELEHSALSKLQQRYKVPFFPIGPFHKRASDSSTSLLEEDKTCLEWLDRQTPASVLYVSIGSFVKMSEKDLVETAWGLANSDQPFLWVVRPGSVDGGSDQLPEDFERVVGDRGRIVKWAPQRSVLSHPAVGGFMSHCGWNSTLESIFEGVPMICSPVLSDQPVNARYLTQVWKVGMELERAERGVIETTIRKLMAGDEGREVRKRVVDLKLKLIESCMEKGGSSYQALDELVEFISSLP